MAIKPVKHISSTMAGTPVVTGQAGTLIAALDCLVNGYNLITMDSLSISGGVLTGAKSSHGFVVDQVIATSANEAALIGEWTVTSVTSGTFTADATGVANTTGTGTLSAKGAGAGWLKVFSGTNKAVYKSGDPVAKGMYLRVDDTGTTTARVVGYESMTDVDTGTGPFPSPVQVSGGGYIFKSSTANATARPWMLFADSLGFYLSTETAANIKKLACFTDFTSEKAGDAYSTILCCATDATSYLSNWGYSAIASAQLSLVGDSGGYVPRSYTQLGSSVTCVMGSLGINSLASGASGGLTYPSPASNGLIISTFILKEASQPVFRGLAAPGVFATPQAVPLTHGDKVANVSGLPGRKVMAVALPASGGEGRVFFDIVGPWR